jgi:hypothetical protein
MKDDAPCRPVPSSAAATRAFDNPAAPLNGVAAARPRPAGQRGAHATALNLIAEAQRSEDRNPGGGERHVRRCRPRPALEAWPMRWTLEAGLAQRPRDRGHAGQRPVVSLPFGSSDGPERQPGQWQRAAVCWASATRRWTRARACRLIESQTGLGERGLAAARRHPAGVQRQRCAWAWAGSVGERLTHGRRESSTSVVRRRPAAASRWAPTWRLTDWARASTPAGNSRAAGPTLQGASATGLDAVGAGVRRVRTRAAGATPRSSASTGCATRSAAADLQLASGRAQRQWDGAAEGLAPERRGWNASRCCRGSTAHRDHGHAERWTGLQRRPAVARQHTRRVAALGRPRTAPPCRRTSASTPRCGR